VPSLAFIFRGSLLDVGTPAEIVAAPRCAPLRWTRQRPSEGAAPRSCAPTPEVEEVAHFGTELRVTTRSAQATRSVVKGGDGRAGCVVVARAKCA
jgi:hypothetical protein